MKRKGFEPMPGATLSRQIEAAASGAYLAPRRIPASGAVVVPEARAFVSRKIEEGRSYKEALRALQRHLSNVVYRRLVDDARRLEISP